MAESTPAIRNSNKGFQVTVGSTPASGTILTTTY